MLGYHNNSDTYNKALSRSVAVRLTNDAKHGEGVPAQSGILRSSSSHSRKYRQRG